MGATDSSDTAVSTAATAQDEGAASFHSLHYATVLTILHLMCLISIVLFGGWLRWQQLTAQSLWLDEGFTVMFARQSWPVVFGLSGQYDPHPPLYYALVKLTTVFLPEVSAARYLSFVTGTLTIIAVYALVSRIANRWAGLGTATVLALSPLHIYYSQEGRQYAVTALAVTLSYLALAEFYAETRPWVAAAYGGVTLLAIYLDYSAFYALAFQVFIIGFIIYRHRRQAQALAIAILAMLLGFLPWSLQLLNTLGAVGTDRAGYLGVTTDKVRTSILSVIGLGGNGSYFLSDVQMPWERWGTIHVALVGAILLLLTLAMILLLRYQPALLLISGCLFVGTIVTAALVSLRSPGYADRTVMYAVLGWSILLGAAPFVAPKPRLLSGGALIGSVAFIAVMTISINAIHHDYFKQQWRSVATDLATAPPETPIFSFPGRVSQTLFEAYQPEILGGRITALDNGATLQPPLSNGRSAPALWFAYGDYDGADKVRRQLHTLGYEQVMHRYYFHPLYLDLYTQPGVTLGEAILVNSQFQGAEQEAEGWQLTGTHSFIDSPGEGRQLRLTGETGASSRATLAVAAIPHSLYTVSFDARVAVTTGEAKAWLICTSPTGNWSYAAPHGGGMPMVNDGTWHATKIAAVCPADTASVLIDLRNEGTGTAEIRQVSLHEVVSPPRRGGTVAMSSSKQTFNEVKGGGEWPDYAQLGPGGKRAIPLILPATAPRVVRITYFDLAGRDLELFVNDQPIGTIRAGASGGKWITKEFALPHDVGARFTLQLHNPGVEISAFSTVEVISTGKK